MSWEQPGLGVEWRRIGVWRESETDSAWDDVDQPRDRRQRRESAEYRVWHKGTGEETG